jgi:hypothetical protein
MIYETIHSPLTYRLWIASDHLQGIRASIASDLSLRSASVITKMVLIFAGVSEGLWRLTPRLLEQIKIKFYSPLGAALLFLYVFGAHLWTVAHVRYLPAVANAELAFAKSLFKSTEPTLGASFPSQYFRDFVGQSAAARGDAVRAPTLPIGLPEMRMRHPLRNILMIVMESVGTRISRYAQARIVRRTVPRYS